MLYLTSESLLTAAAIVLNALKLSGFRVARGRMEDNITFDEIFLMAWNMIDLNKAQILKIKQLFDCLVSDVLVQVAGKLGSKLKERKLPLGGAQGETFNNPPPLLDFNFILFNTFDHIT